MNSKNYFAPALVIIFAVLVIYGLFMVWQRPPALPTFAPYDASKTETGRWIMFNPKDLTAKPGVRMMAVAGGKQIEGLNAFVFEKEPPQVRSFETNGWVIQKELIHHVFQWSCNRCQTIPCPTDPGPTPTPTPQPGPTPGPGPIEADKSWGRQRVHAKEAQALVDTSNVKVCVVDTGIDMQHPNRGNVIATQDYSGKGSAQDGAGHGTHTAGTIAGLGGVGISRAKLYICKGLSDQGSGTSSALASCLSWCGSQGAQIVSNSWGSPQSDQMINAVIAQLTTRGIYVFVAAGNDSGPVNWPAKLAGSNPLVYAIAASNQADQITSFSSRGPEVRFISPGQGIVSNWPGGGTRSLDGTSMATPHAAAICAFGVARGLRPCIKTSGLVGNYPFADALATAQ